MTSAFTYVFMLASSSNALTLSERTPFFSMTGTVRKPTKSGLMLLCTTIVVSRAVSLPFVRKVARFVDSLSCSARLSFEISLSSRRFTSALCFPGDICSTIFRLWSSLWCVSVHPSIPQVRLRGHDLPRWSSPRQRKQSCSHFATAHLSRTLL